MNTKVIVAIETLIVTLLAVTVVMYGQIIWQQFRLAQLQAEVQLDPGQEIETTTVQNEGQLSDEEKLRVLDVLKSESVPSELSPAEVLGTLDQTDPGTAEPQLSSEDKLRILEGLQ